MKIKLTIFVVMLVLFALTGCCFPSGSSTTAKTTITEGTAAETTTSEAAIPETTAQPAIEKGEYNIGETGPAGGLIFYVNPNYANDGWRYLEAAPNDQSTGILWDYGKDVATGATATVVGTGQANTQTIVKALGAGSYGSYAAQLCDDLTQGGYSEWFLPSKDELNEMRENLYLNSVGDFAEYYYWSSSESNSYASLAWTQHFTTGGQCTTNKITNLRVRAVRAF